MERLEITKKTALGLCILLCGCGDLKTKMGLEKNPPDASLVHLPAKGWAIPPELRPLSTLTKDALERGHSLNSDDQEILNRIRTSP
jgi:hypothetical protein